MARDDEQQAMTSERLAELRQRMEAIPGSIFVKTQKELSQTFFDRNELVGAMEVMLAEVERLRAREAALLAVVERVATMLYIPLLNDLGATTREICGGCARSFRRDDSGWFSEDSRHAPDCVVEQARALLASAGDGEQGEA